MSLTEFVVREVESAPVAYASAETPLEALGPTIGRLLGQVGAAAGTQGVSMSGPPFCRYTDWQETSCTVECGMRTNGDLAPTEAVQIDTLGEPGLHLCFSYFGPYEHLHASYEEAEVWMKANGYVWNGAPWDSYITDPMAEPDSAKWQTDVCIPICKA